MDRMGWWLACAAVAMLAAAGCGPAGREETKAKPVTQFDEAKGKPLDLYVPAAKGAGNAACSRCGASGKVPNSCPACAGGGRCKTCSGSGRVRLSANPVTRQYVCSSCGGRGHHGYIGGIRQTCWTCGGSGYVKKTEPQWTEAQCLSCSGRGACATCNGSGEGAGQHDCPRCKASGRVWQGKSGFLGVVLDTAKEGARIKAVYPGSPAAQAGLGVDDVLVRVGGSSVTGPADALGKLRGLFADATHEFAVLRQGQVVTYKIKLSRYP